MKKAELKKAGIYEYYMDFIRRFINGKYYEKDFEEFLVKFLLDNPEFESETKPKIEIRELEEVHNALYFPDQDLILISAQKVKDVYYHRLAPIELLVHSAHELCHHIQFKDKKHETYKKNMVNSIHPLVESQFVHLVELAKDFIHPAYFKKYNLSSFDDLKGQLHDIYFSAYLNKPFEEEARIYGLNFANTFLKELYKFNVHKVNKWIYYQNAALKGIFAKEKNYDKQYKTYTDLVRCLKLPLNVLTNLDIAIASTQPFSHYDKNFKTEDYRSMINESNQILRKLIDFKFGDCILAIQVKYFLYALQTSSLIMADELATIIAFNKNLKFDEKFELEEEILKFYKSKDATCDHLLVDITKILPIESCEHLLDFYFTSSKIRYCRPLLNYCFHSEFNNYSQDQKSKLAEHVCEKLIKYALHTFDEVNGEKQSYVCENFPEIDLLCQMVYHRVGDENKAKLDYIRGIIYGNSKNVEKYNNNFPTSIKERNFFLVYGQKEFDNFKRDVNIGKIEYEDYLKNSQKNQ